MNIQKFTQKSMEAIQDCEKLAYEYGNQEIEQEHLLVALLQQEDGLILKLIEKMEIQGAFCRQCNPPSGSRNQGVRRPGLCRPGIE